MYRLATVFGLTAVPPFPTGFVGCAGIDENVDDVLLLFGSILKASF